MGDNSSALQVGLNAAQAENVDAEVQGRAERLVSASRSSSAARRRAAEAILGDPQRNIAFAGKPTASPIEREVLAVLGRLLFDAGTQLHLPRNKNQANDAIAAGYKAAGGICKFHSRLVNKAPTLILYLDDDMIRKLDNAVPEWRNNKDWIKVDTLEKLVTLGEAALMFMDEQEQ